MPLLNNFQYQHCINMPKTRCMFCIPDTKSADQKKTKKYVTLEISINDNT